MKIVRAASLLAVLLFATVSPAAAGAPRSTRDVAGQNLVTHTFTLHVIGRPDRRATFWVAFGPLQGRFGIVRLRRSASADFYTARVFLPARGRAVFAYLEGKGLMHSRVGDVPGDPVITVARTAPLSLVHADIPQVAWHAPLG